MATEYVFHYINMPTTDKGKEYYDACYFEDDSLHDGSTMNPINIYYYKEGDTVHITYTAQDLDCIQGYCYSSDYGWERCDFIYYNRKWKKIYPIQINPVYDDDTARCEEGLQDYIIDQWNDNAKVTEYYIYATAYNPITINDQEFNVPEDSYIVTDENYNRLYMNPGFWTSDPDVLFRAISAYEPEDSEYVFNTHISILGREICSHYVGGTSTALQDGDTNSQVVISGNIYTAKDYDRVKCSTNNHIFIYCDGVWYDLTYRTSGERLLADMAPPSYGPGDTVPEISEIINRYPDEPDSGDRYKCVYPDRLLGLGINVLTINGTTTDIQAFDTIRLNNLDRVSWTDGYYTYYTYCPCGAWADRYYLLSEQHAWIMIRDEVLEYDKCVELKWEDPNDITTYEPTPATWEGTIVIRKEDSAPIHRWDGVEIVDSTTRDKYKTDPYRDEDIQLGKTYYYGFFPYYTAATEDGHPIKFYRFTAVRRVDTGVDTNAPTILSAVADGTTVTVSYKIPMPVEGEYNSIKLYGKIGSNPKGDGNDDVSVDIDRSEDEVIIENLQPESTYYFAIITIQGEET